MGLMARSAPHWALPMGGRPAFLLTGDLAFLHDSNALLLREELKGSLTVVLINNNGGGIFEHLPVAKAPDNFERFFATPQSVDLGQLCAAHGGQPHPDFGIGLNFWLRSKRKRGLEFMCWSC